ncbi:hypothetical protein NA509_21205, partial [Salmonella sp. NW508]
CNPTSSKFIHTWLRFGEIMRGSLSAKPVTTGIGNNFRGYMMRNNNTFYTLIESDNENVWDMSVEEKGTQQNKDAVQKVKYQLNAIFDNGTC